ncbi:hypothetical protein M0R72_04325 [Candidatus Pacearchaeota archaeon]|jgi:hypothetical protein|nr:hypothetical protein [Candidatus Pacearchaeota archaeon]
MQKKNNPKRNNKIIIVSVVCFVLISISTYFIFFKQERNLEEFRSNDGRMGDSQLTPEIENEITSFFESSPSDLEIETYCSENLMYCRYYCQNSYAEFCETIKPEGMPNETREFNYSR